MCDNCGCDPVFVEPLYGAGPTDTEEQAVLAEEFGEPDEEGRYGPGGGA